MRYLENEIYQKDIEAAIRHSVGFDDFHKKRILLLGASGLIGSFITDCFFHANDRMDAQNRIYAMSRNRKELQERFGEEYEDKRGSLHFIEADVTAMNLEQNFDYIIHGASHGHPKAFRETPVEVLMSNVLGIRKTLEIARRSPGCRVLYISSGEVQEEVDHLLVRACYPVGKKAAETLCIACKEEYGTDTVIARPCHTFGANMAKHDNRAAAQFLAASANGEDIEMYSAGKQIRTFSYVADCVSGLLTALARGKSGAVYGISSGESCSVRAFAGKCACAGNCSVKIHTPTDMEKAEISPIGNQFVDNGALKNLGWQPAFSMEEGIRHSIRIIREMGGV